LEHQQRHQLRLRRPTVPLRVRALVVLVLVLVRALGQVALFISQCSGAVNKKRNT